MKPRPAVLAALIGVLAAFVAYTVYVGTQHRFLDFFREAFRTPANIQIAWDLTNAVTLGIIWIAYDARSRGVRAWPWGLFSLALGSIGLLGYLVYREVRRGADPTQGTHPPR